MKFSHKILVYFPHESQENAKVNHPNVYDKEAQNNTEYPLFNGIMA